MAIANEKISSPQTPGRTASATRATHATAIARRTSLAQAALFTSAPSDREVGGFLYPCGLHARCRVRTDSVLVLGGGLSGAAAAYTLARAGARDVTVIESGSTLGGLAGSFEQRGEARVLGHFAGRVEDAAREIVEEPAIRDDLFGGRHRGEQLAHPVVILLRPARRVVDGVDV